jgi:hypothetical protein
MLRVLTVTTDSFLAFLSRSLSKANRGCQQRAQSGRSHLVKADIRSQGCYLKRASSIRNIDPKTTTGAVSGLPEYRYTFRKTSRRRM